MTTSSAPISDVANFYHGSTPSKARLDFWNGSIPWASPKDFSSSRLEKTEDHVTESAISDGDAVVANPGSVLVVVRSGILKRRLPVAVVGTRLTFNQDVKCIRPHAERLTPDYLALFLRAVEPFVIHEGVKVGPTVHSIKSGFLEHLKIPLPPLAEQERIAARLAEQLAAVESARAAAQARLAAAEALPAAYLREVFEGPEASEWETRRLGELMQRHNEIIHPGDRDSGEAIFVGLEHIESTTGRRTDSLRIDLGKLTGRKPAFRKGQIIYGYLRPYLNKVWIAEFDGCSSVDQFAFDVFDEVADAAFVAAFMRSETFLRRSEVVTTTGQLPRISIDEILAVEINVPALSEQRRIVAALTLRLAETERLTAILRDELAAIDALPAALLRDAFNGYTDSQGG